jgi:hypothetical protein
MTVMTMLSIFEEELEVEDTRPTYSSTPVACPECGEISPNAYLREVNHGTVFNGWCHKRLIMNDWAKPGTWAEQHTNQFETASKWLAARGWKPCDQFDSANWPDGFIPYWEENK